MIRRRAGSALLALVLTSACQSGGVLDLEVFNESQADVVVELRGPRGADVGVRQVVRPDAGFAVRLERPGPGGWSVVVDGQVVTDSTEWPDDNPTIDLSVVIRRDGSVVVQDT